MINLEKYNNLTDDKLFSKVIEYDHEAIVYFFYKRFKENIKYSVIKIFGDNYSTEEMLNEFFLYLENNNWHYLKSFDFSRNIRLSTWISVVSYRFFLKIKKTEKLIDFEQGETIIEKFDNNNEKLIKEVEKAILEISNDRDREIAFQLLAGKEIANIADDMNIDKDYAYTLKNRIIKIIQKQIKTLENEK